MNVGTFAVYSFIRHMAEHRHKVFLLAFDECSPLNEYQRWIFDSSFFDFLIWLLLLLQKIKKRRKKENKTRCEQHKRLKYLIERRNKNSLIIYTFEFEHFEEQKSRETYNNEDANHLLGQKISKEYNIMRYILCFCLRSPIVMRCYCLF